MNARLDKIATERKRLQEKQFDDGPEEFQWLNYCYHCGRRFDLDVEEVEPQTCADCAKGNP